MQHGLGTSSLYICVVCIEQYSFCTSCQSVLHMGCVGAQRSHGGVDGQLTWKGSVKTLQRLHLTMLILGGGGQLMVKLVRIHKVPERICAKPSWMSIDPPDQHCQR